MTQASDNVAQKVAANVDRLQRRYHVFGFSFAVVKKYADDNAGQRAALLTYYGFLALFPLLLVGTAAADFIAQHNTGLRTRLLADVTSYFPVIGQQLQQNINIHDHKTSLAFIVGLLFTFYGTHGIADAVRGTLDTAWGTPRTKRARFPEGLLKSLALLFGAGVGLAVTTALASYATAELGHSFLFRAVPIIINVVLLYLIFMYVFIVGTSHRRPRSDLRFGAIIMTVGLLILQTVGGYLITHELHRSSALYGQFALVLVILFWIYLLAQLFTYAVEANTVHTLRLWPRALDSANPTTADKKAQTLYTAK